MIHPNYTAEMTTNKLRSAEEIEDDWLFDAIHKYKHLLMYDLQNAVQSLTWSGDRSVCVISSKGDKHELLELSLPEKILTADESQGLCSDRDFRVICGGFSDRKLKEIKHVPNQRLLASTDGHRNSLSLWSMGNENTDLIKLQSTIENPHRKSLSSTLDVQTNQAIFGSTLDDICLVDLQSNAILQNTAPESELPARNKLNGIVYLDENSVLMSCCESLLLWKCDLREGLVKGKVHKPREATGEFWTSDVKNSTVMSLCSSGALLTFDLRDLTNPTSLTSLAGCEKNKNSSYDFFSIKMSPLKESICSVSGLDGCVHIYNTNSSHSGDHIPATFTHQGHMICNSQSDCVSVMSHSWHPWQPNLILSSASDGSLHGWQPETLL